MKAIIVEDKPYIREGLKSLIEMINKGVNIVGECGNVKDAVTVAKACTPDLIFLDVNLPDGNAFDFLAQTNMLEYKVIFITAYDEYALKALKMGAVDYILKPIDIGELEGAIDKVIETDIKDQKQKIAFTKEQLNPNRLVVSLQDSYQVIKLDELKYCKSDKGYTTFYIENSKNIIVSKPLKFFIDKLPEDRFVRTHQSCLVNLNFIDKYDKSGVIVLKDKNVIPVSIRKREEFLLRLLEGK